MAWLKLDDGFASHPKVAALNDREFRIWVRTLLYCARYRTQGHVPRGAATEVGGLTDLVRKRFGFEGLLDTKYGEEWIHDWDAYNPKDPTAADRMERYRQRQREEEERNENRNGDVTEPVTPTVTEPVTETEPRALAGAGDPSNNPVPSLEGSGSSEVEGEETAAGSSTDETAADVVNLEELRGTLGDLGWWPGQIEAAERDPKRAMAWVEAARKSADSNPGSYARQGFESGGWPTAQNGKVPADLFRSCLNYVSSPEALDEVFTEGKLLEEFERKEHKLRQSLSSKQRDELVGKWAELRAEAS